MLECDVLGHSLCAASPPVGWERCVCCGQGCLRGELGALGVPTRVSVVPKWKLAQSRTLLGDARPLWRWWGISPLFPQLPSVLHHKSAVSAGSLLESDETFFLLKSSSLGMFPCYWLDCHCVFSCVSVVNSREFISLFLKIVVTRALGFLQDRQHLVGSVWLLLAWLHVRIALQWSDSRRIGVVRLLNLFPPGERPRRGLPQAGAGVPCSPNLRLIRAKPSFCFPAGEAGGCAGPSVGAVVLEGNIGKWGGSLCPSRGSAFHQNSSFGFTKFRV